MKLLFATQNPGKLSEVQGILGSSISVTSLKDMGHEGELSETHSTLEENAAEKARLIYVKYKMNCFAEDTGLEVEALNGAPGVHSARYAGEGKNASDNILLLLQSMRDIAARNAQFRTVVCLILNGKEHFFEGITKGSISEFPRGNSGFGYDPVFVPEGFQKTFAEMDKKEKNSLSHRGKAIRAMKEFVRGIYQ